MKGKKGDKGKRGSDKGKYGKSFGKYDKNNEYSKNNEYGKGSEKGKGKKGKGKGQGKEGLLQVMWQVGAQGERLLARLRASHRRKFRVLPRVQGR